MFIGQKANVALSQFYSKNEGRQFCCRTGRGRQKVPEVPGSHPADPILAQGPETSSDCHRQPEVRRRQEETEAGVCQKLAPNSSSTQVTKFIVSVPDLDFRSQFSVLSFDLGFRSRLFQPKKVHPVRWQVLKMKRFKWEYERKNAGA